MLQAVRIMLQLCLATHRVRCSRRYRFVYRICVCQLLSPLLWVEWCGAHVWVGAGDGLHAASQADQVGLQLQPQLGEHGATGRPQGVEQAPELRLRCHPGHVCLRVLFEAAALAVDALPADVDAAADGVQALSCNERLVAGQHLQQPGGRAGVICSLWTTANGARACCN